MSSCFNQTNANANPKPTNLSIMLADVSYNSQIYGFWRSLWYGTACRAIEKLFILYLYRALCSVKPTVEKAELVIPLIQQNRWMNARKPEDLENDNAADHESIKGGKRADIQQTGDKVTDAAVREILGNMSSEFYSCICVLYSFCTTV